MIERPLYLSRLQAWKDSDMIKVITGVRRCGKSSLLINFADKLIESGVNKNCIIQMNFEDMIYEDIDYKTLNNIIVKHLEKNKNKKTYIFLDEIQKIDKWEKTLASLRLKKNVDLYITGSNAYLLSGELATLLSGRYIEIKMLPLSFKEFLTFYTFPEGTTISKKFNTYMRLGGMPSLKDCNFDEKKINENLDGIYNTVLVKDIFSRANVKDTQTIQKILTFMADNIANKTSINSITNTLYSSKSITSKNNNVIENYIALFEKAFIFYKVKRYDIKGKELLNSLEKYYIVDSGLRTHILGRLSDTGRVIENIVYFELLRRGYKVSVGKFYDNEIDFIAYNEKEKLYIQVCEDITTEKTKNREITPLEKIKDSFPKIILTTNEIEVQTTGTGIQIISLTDWLLK